MVHELHSDIALKLKKEAELRAPNHFDMIRKKLAEQIAEELIKELNKGPSLEGRLFSEERSTFTEKIMKNEVIGA